MAISPAHTRLRSNATSSFVYFFAYSLPFRPSGRSFLELSACRPESGIERTFHPDTRWVRTAPRPTQMYEWARHSYALFMTLGLGYAGWFVLLGGVIVVISSVRARPHGWEVVGVILVAFVPAAWATLLNYYHPQDLVALGLALTAVACVERRNWVWAVCFSDWRSHPSSSYCWCWPLSSLLLAAKRDGGFSSRRGGWLL